LEHVDLPLRFSEERPMLNSLLGRVGLVIGVLAGGLGLTLVAQSPATVSDAVLQAPPAGAWPTYGRDYAETHHSPLAQINATNAAQLKLAWTADIGSEGKVEATPLVWQDTVYLTTTWSTVVAVEARTGRVKWRWDPEIKRGGPAAKGPTFCCGPVNRGVALYRDKVYAGLLDGRLVALDAATGRVVWTAQTTPPDSDYSVTGAPRVARGLVIIGNGGGEFGTRGYVTAYDAETGAERWRFYTVPGDPAKPFENAAMERAAKTWSGEWWKVGGGGGTVWDAMAYDPAANLLYIGTGNGSPQNHDARSAGIGDNLYLSSIIALRPETGEYVWHFQTTPNDTWDFTATQPIILADLTIDGRRRQVLMQAPKNGFFYVLDRLTGEFISGKPYVSMTWATGLDAKGRPIQVPEAHYGFKSIVVSPGPIGGHNWQPMAWNPSTGLVYFPGQESGAHYARDPKFKYEPRNPAGNRGIIRTGLPNKGFLLAWDPVAQQARWRLDHSVAGGLLSTAGDLVFGGNSRGEFFALDGKTGARLWQQRLQQGVATPVSYELDGKQYVTVLAGATGAKLYTFGLDGAAGSQRMSQGSDR